MLRLKRIAAVVLAAILCAGLLPCVSLAAEAPAGLAAFSTVKEYSDGTFSDVSSDAWYASGVRTVYELNIMNGTDLGFEPSGTVTWSQAVTIAARLHAIYNGAEIPDAEGPWYAKYYNYADRAGLLPATHPSAGDANTVFINRQELAMLFRNVLSDEDLPVINDANATDIATVNKLYRDAVQDMYSSGILTGKEGGRFDPEGITTRAEIAVVVTRLLRPAQRVSRDSRSNQAMVDQYGNYLMGGNTVSADGVCYYILTELCRDSEDKSVKLSSIVARTDAGELRTIYTTDKIRLGFLSLDEKGLLYFIEGGTDLIRLNPATGKAETLYTAPKLVVYTLYDGEIYLSAQYNQPAKLQDARYRIGRLKNGSLEILVDNMLGSMYMDDSFYCFGGKLYYIQGDNRNCLWSLDLSGGKPEKVIDVSDMEKTVSNVAYDGATIWFWGSLKNGAYGFLKRVNLLLPELEETVCEIPDEIARNYQKLYCNDGQVYYQSSGAQGLWAVSSSGEFTRLVTLDNIGTEASFVSPQGIFLVGVKTIYMTFNDQVKVITPQGETLSYTEFLHRPYLITGVSNLVPAEGTERNAEAEAFDEVFDQGITRSFRTEDGDYVAEITIVNKSDEPFSLKTISMYLSETDLHLRPNLAASSIPAKTTQVFTFVIPEDMLSSVTQADLDTAYFHLWG